MSSNGNFGRGKSTIVVGSFLVVRGSWLRAHCTLTLDVSYCAGCGSRHLLTAQANTSDQLCIFRFQTRFDLVVLVFPWFSCELINLCNYSVLLYLRLTSIWSRCVDSHIHYSVRIIVECMGNRSYDH